jgi:hypothetical protein
MNKEKLVELAKVEFNIFHSLQKRELESSDCSDNIYILLLYITLM